MKHDFTIWRNQILQNPQNISPLKFGMSQDEVIEIFGKPDAVSTMRSDGKPLILKYHDIELHFDRKAPHGLYLVYSDDEIELSITDHHEELLQPITNIETLDNEFFFAFIAGKQVLCFSAVPGKSLGADHFRYRAGRVPVMSDMTERGICVACQWCKEKRGFENQILYLHDSLDENRKRGLCQDKPCFEREQYVNFY